MYASFLGYASETATRAMQHSDYVFESRELAPVVVCWLLSECRRLGFSAIVQELEAGTLHRRLAAAFEPHFDVRDAGLTVRDMHKRLNGGMPKSILDRLRNR